MLLTIESPGPGHVQFSIARFEKETGQEGCYIALFVSKVDKISFWRVHTLALAHQNLCKKLERLEILRLSAPTDGLQDTWGLYVKRDLKTRNPAEIALSEVGAGRIGVLRVLDADNSQTRRGGERKKRDAAGMAGR